MKKIKDIYAGKPDAKDEVETDGIDPFIENYVVPENFNKDELVKGTACFVTGYKGTGKTALLYYLDSYIREIDEQTCSSFIFFKGDYSDIKKQEMEQLSQRLFSTITISNDVVLDGNDFEYIWRWLLYSRIIEDNQQNNDSLFIHDEKWERFVKVISQIQYSKKKRILSIPQSVNLECKFTDPATYMEILPKVCVNFCEKRIEESDGYRLFVNVIDEADELFADLIFSNRTDIPYYLFVDELEAYYGEKSVFLRDLNLIRDLVFSVKKMNQIMGKNRTVKTKIICSVRSEIINSINRFVVSKEINKVISGFEVPLRWDYKNTNSFQHPILKILIKRIKYVDDECHTEKAIIDKWFPEQINGIDAANYILNNSWCKPRDIVRLILSAQSCMAADNENFSQSTIDMCKKKYSQDSLDEIREEMRALYSASEIDIILSCLTGFKRIFSVSELKARVDEYYNNTFLKEKMMNVLMDLYRLGIIGNYFDGSYRWQHKGDDSIICDSTWKLIIHPSLLSVLSVNSKQDSAIEKMRPKQGDHVLVTIDYIFEKYAIGSFGYGAKNYRVFLPISLISDERIVDINEYITKGKKYGAKLYRFDRKHNDWIISMKN